VDGEMEELGHAGEAWEGGGESAGWSQGPGVFDEGFARVTNKDLERFIDEVVQEDAMEDFMRDENAMEAGLRDDTGAEDEDCDDFKLLVDLSLFHGRIRVQGCREPRTFFVLKGEDVDGVLKAIGVDTTMSIGQRKVVSNGGLFSTLLTIQSIERRSGTEFNPVSHAIEQMRDAFGEDVPESLYKWVSQKKQATSGSIAKVESILAERATHEDSWSAWKVKDVAELLKSMKPAKLTTTTKFKCREKLKTQKQAYAKRRVLAARVYDDRFMIHDLEQCMKFLHAIKEELRISSEKWCHTSGNRKMNLRRLLFAGCLPQTSLMEIPGIKSGMMKALFDGIQHVVNATTSFDHGGSSAKARRQTSENDHPSSTFSGVHPEIILPERSGSSEPSVSGPDGREIGDDTSKSAPSPAEDELLVSGALEPIEQGLRAAKSMLEHAKAFCRSENIEIPPLKDHYAMRSLPGQRANRRYNEGCEGSISIKRFENSDLQMLVVDFIDGKNLHSCDIKNRPEDQKLPMEVRERIEKLLESRVPPRFALEQIQEDSRRESGRSSRYKVTLRTISHILDHSNARWKLGKTDEEDIAKRVNRDRSSEHPFFQAYKPHGVDASDERCFGFENTGPPP